MNATKTFGPTYIYHENCSMAGRAVPMREVDDCNGECGDWSPWEASSEKEALATIEGLESKYHPYKFKVAQTLRDAWDLPETVESDE